MTKLGIVLEDLVKLGRLHPAKARTFKMMASSLVTSIRNTNNEAFGKEPQSPI